MSVRILCFNYVPDAEEFAWAEALLVPGMTCEAITALPQALAWQLPLKVSLPLGEPTPESWAILRDLWASEDFLFEEYTVRDDPRCTRPLGAAIE